MSKKIMIMVFVAVMFVMSNIGVQAAEATEDHYLNGQNICYYVNDVPLSGYYEYKFQSEYGNWRCGYYWLTTDSLWQWSYYTGQWSIVLHLYQYDEGYNNQPRTERNTQYENYYGEYGSILRGEECYYVVVESGSVEVCE